MRRLSLLQRVEGALQRAGAIERDLADVHANLSDIKEGREPADFRSGTLAMRSQLPLLASRQKISFAS